MLFDFSLTRTSRIRRHASLSDLFLRCANPRWDFAERFALAVTLHEMVTGVPPRWGDGKTQPRCRLRSHAGCRVADPCCATVSLRSSPALNRNLIGRLITPKRCCVTGADFSRPASASQQSADLFEAVARLATASTNMAELGYSVEAQNVLSAAIHNARELLAVDRVRFRYLRGVGDRIRAKSAPPKPWPPSGRTSCKVVRRRNEADDDSASAGAISVNELAAQLPPRRPGRRRPCRKKPHWPFTRSGRGPRLDLMDAAGVAAKCA